MLRPALVGIATIAAGSAAGADFPLVVLVTERADVDAAVATEIVEAVSSDLRDQGLAIAASPQAAQMRLKLRGAGDTASCEGRVDCVAALAEPFGKVTVVGLQLAKVGRKLAIIVSAVRPDPPETLVTQSFAVRELPAGGEDLRRQLVEFGRKLRDISAERLGRAASVAVAPAADAKKQRSAEPAVAPPLVAPAAGATATAASPAAHPTASAPVPAFAARPTATVAEVRSVPSLPSAPPAPLAAPAKSRPSVPGPPAASPGLAVAPPAVPATDPRRAAPSVTVRADRPLVSPPRPTTVELSVPPKRPATAATPALRYVAYGLAGLAVGTAGFGAYQGVSASTASKGLRSTSETFADDQQRVLSTARTADIAYATAAGLAVVAIITWLLGGPARSNAAASPSGAGAGLPGAPSS